MCQLKETFCLSSGANINYGDDFRRTLLPSYCNCRNDECTINGLVTQYKDLVRQFEHLYPHKLSYTMNI